MKKDKTFDWNSLATRLSAGLQQEQNSLQLKDTPFYPLAFHAEMPQHVEYENGHLSFRFRDLAVHALSDLSLNAGACRHKANELTIAMRLTGAALKGRYEINTKYAGRITLDTGGNMRELDESFAREAGASDNGVPPLTQAEIDAMVTQARDQREPIQGTVHGPTLMSTYNEHSESYNTAFVTSAELRELWAEGGVTTQMSRDTHEALKSNQVVNDPNKKYANGDTYNLNAGGQQLNVAIALTSMAEQARNDGNPALEKQYNDAAMAAINFNETVNQTGDGTQPASMTGSQVYATLNNTTLSMVRLSVQEFKNRLDQANDEESKEGGADVAAMQNGWKILSGNERKMIRERMFRFRKELAAIKDVQPQLLWAGDCHAELKGMEAMITVKYDKRTAAWKVNNSHVTLPAFYLEVDDAAWSGKAAGIVRERLANMHFVKSLLQTKIQSGIQSILEKAVLRSLLPE